MEWSLLRDRAAQAFDAVYRSRVLAVMVRLIAARVCASDAAGALVLLRKKEAVG
jgi:hypothetical protein